MLPSLILSRQRQNRHCTRTMNTVSLAAERRRETVWLLDPLVRLVARS